MCICHMDKSELEKNKAEKMFSLTRSQLRVSENIFFMKSNPGKKDRMTFLY